jgi:hypothetical protein
MENQYVISLLLTQKSSKIHIRSNLVQFSIWFSFISVSRLVQYFFRSCRWKFTVSNLFNYSTSINNVLVRFHKFKSKKIISHKLFNTILFSVLTIYKMSIWQIEWRKGYSLLLQCKNRQLGTNHCQCHRYMQKLS